MKPLWKTSWSILKKVKDRIIIWSSNSTLEYRSKRIERKILKWYLYLHVHRSIILSSKKVEAPKGPLTGESINKMWCIYVYSAVLFSLRKEGNSDLCYNTDEPWGNSEISQSQRTNTVWFYWYEVPKVLNSWGQELEWWVPWAAGSEELLFNVYRVSVLKDKRSSVAGWWWSLYNIVNILNTSELCTYSWSS